MINLSRPFGLLLILQVFSLLSGLVFIVSNASLISLLPVALGLIIVCFDGIKNSSGYVLVLLFIAWMLVIDDISQVAWGRNYTAFTEILGMTMFESFGLMGAELAVILLLAIVLLKLRYGQLANLYRKGLLVIILASSVYFFSTFPSLIVGLMNGGNLNVHFIQNRFVYLMPLSCLLGFLTIVQVKQLSWLYFVMASIIFVKSVQAVAIYYSNLRLFSDAEYLVDHYFSMFSVLTLVVAINLILNKTISIWLKIALVMAHIPVIWAFILNDRRTAFVALGLFMVILPSVYSIRWLRANLTKVKFTSFFLAPFVLLVMVGPEPIGIGRQAIQSVIGEAGLELPSYRELENQNLLNAVATAPLTGIGTGKEFEEIYQMPDISFVYERYRMIPHNLVLAAWAFGGPISLASMGILFISMIATAIKLGKHQQLLLATALLAFVIQYFCFSFADLAFQIPRNQIIAGLLFGGSYRILGELKEASHGDDSIT